MKKELQKLIAINLYKIRTKRGLTRDQVAEQAGISTTFYANLECGKKMMSVVTLRKLAEVLCVSTDSLLYEENSTDRLKTIEKLLCGQPEDIVDFIEAFIHLYIQKSPYSAMEKNSIQTESEPR